jgi:hypothetical protein
VSWAPWGNPRKILVDNWRMVIDNYGGIYGKAAADFENMDE